MDYVKCLACGHNFHEDQWAVAETKENKFVGGCPQCHGEFNTKVHMTKFDRLVNALNDKNFYADDSKKWEHDNLWIDFCTEKEEEHEGEIHPLFTGVIHFYEGENGEITMDGERWWSDDIQIRESFDTVDEVIKYIKELENVDLTEYDTNKDRWLRHVEGL